MRISRHCLFFFFIALITSASAQSPEGEFDIQAFIENLFQDQELDLNYEELYENIYQIYLNPLDLNKVTKDELRSLYFLSEVQINNLFEYLAENGTLLSIYELQAIEGFDLSTLQMLAPLVVVGNTQLTEKSLWKRIGKSDGYIIMRYQRTLQEKKGFTAPDTIFQNISNNPGDSLELTSRFKGSPGKMYLRFRKQKARDFSLGFTLEKDEGEEITWKPGNKQYGADFYSFHFMVENKGKIKKAVLGDYQLQIGQGLITGAGFNLGKGAEPITPIRRNHLGILPYTSILEANFLRGAATTIQYDPLELTLFASYQHLDATFKKDSLSELENFVTGIRNTGLHRTETELASRDNLTELVYGGNLTYQSRDQDFTFGMTYLYQKLDRMLKEDQTVFNRFNFRGNKNFNLGAFYHYQWENLNFFSEVAVSKSRGLGAVSGILASLSSKVETSLLFRHYDRDFHAPFSGAFSENTRPQNEQGLYWGLKITPIKKWGLATYIDTFSFPWLRFRADAPSDGHEFLTRIFYKPSREIVMYAQYRQENKETNTFDGEKMKLNQLETGIKRSYLINIQFPVNKIIDTRSRIQWSTYSVSNQRSQGFTILQDATVKLKKFAISGRIALFDTDDFNTRQYVYEKDVLYSFNFPAYSGIGVRNYLLLKYKLSRKIKIWAKYANSKFNDREKISSGLNEIDGRKKTTLKMQLMIEI